MGMTQNLSREAKSALLSCLPRQGAKPTMRVAPEALDELKAAGIMRATGLTRQGMTARKALLESLEDAAFGA